MEDDLEIDAEGHFFGLERGTDGIPCPCGGYAGRVDSTEEECKRFGCGRDRPGSECCAASFICRICKRRLSGCYEAPELGW